MSRVPPERASLDNVTVPPTDPLLARDLPEPAASRSFDKDPEQIGPYRILEKIGEGGMGVVYKAEQREPVRRLVALKVIKLGMDTRDVVARFEAERQALALMSHPNVAKVFEAGMTEQGRPFFAMEFVPGVALNRFCDEEKLTIRQRLDLFVPICQAVQHAHQKGIIHRDLKPSNILVQLVDGRPLPKVIDFGVAKATNQALTPHTVYTQLGSMLGTPEYMSPEQAMTGGLDVDTRTDIYSLGAILYELLSGSLPFESKTLRIAGPEGMARLLRETDPPKLSARLSEIGSGDDPLLPQIAKARHSDLSTLRRELRGDLEWIVLKAMEKERGRRYETANGLAMDIRRHLLDEPVLARPPTTIYRLGKLIRRNKLPFIGAAAFVLALLIGLATSTFLFMRESAARRRAAAAELEQTRLRASESSLRRQAQAQELAARRRAFASDMNLVQQALAVNNLGRAQDLLDRQRPPPGEQDLRGWEWRYLWQFCRSDARFTLCQRPASIWSLAVSRDGSRVAIGQEQGGGLSIWDLSTRQLVTQLPAGDDMVSVAFSPTSDLLAFGTAWASASPHPRFSVRLWDGAKEQIVAELPLDSLCQRPVFSDDGQTLIVSTRAKIMLFRVPDGSRLAAYDAPVNYAPGTPFAVSHDRKVAAYGAPGNIIRVIDLASGAARWNVRGPDNFVTALAFSPDDSTLACGSGLLESPILLRDATSGKQTAKLEGHRGWVSSLVFWPDGKTLASSSADQTIRIWDLSHGASASSPRVLRGHRMEVWRMALLPDNRTLVSGCKDGSVNVWDTSTTAHGRTRDDLPATVAAWEFGPDGNSIIAADMQGHVASWYGEGLRQSIPLMDIGPLTALRPVISADCRLIAAATADGRVRVWNIPQRKLVHELNIDGMGCVPWRLSTQNRLDVYCKDDNTLHEYDLVSWQQVRSWRCAGDARAAAFSPDGRWCLTLGWAGASLLQDFDEARESNPNLGIPQSAGAAYSPDGKLLAVSSWLGFVKLYGASTLREQAQLGGFLLGVHSVAFSPDGKRIAAGSNGNEAVKLWDVESHQEVLTLEGEGPRFESTAFSADGNALGSKSSLGRLQIWRAPTWAQIESAERG